jgi:hypothetical protein
MGAFTQFTLAALVSMCAGQEMCSDQTTCADMSAEAMQANAMLQVQAAPADELDMLTENLKLQCAVSNLKETHLAASSTCLPDGLQESHLQAVRRHAALLSSDGGKTAKSETSIDGSDATLDAAGFKAVTSLCCPPQMEVFFLRLLDQNGMAACSIPHIQGLMHWFSCVPDMDFQYLLDIIANGNPCKYWALKGAACPVISAQCQGKYCR